MSVSSVINCVSILLEPMSVLVRKATELKVMGRSVKAVCVGGGAFTENEEKELRQSGCFDLFTQIDADDNTLAQYYKNARCFVYPSCYEGFGIPILEAFKLGCPVILANASCFPEIAGDAASYFPSEDHKELARKIIEIIDSDSLREKLREGGYRRVEQFNWNNSANETYEYYYSLINK